MRKSGKRPKRKVYLTDFLIGGLVCVGVPALMTACAPVSWLEFTRAGEQVRVKTQTCLFFVIPYRVHELADVQRVETTFHGGRHQRDRRGNDRHEEKTADLVLHGPQEGQNVSVPVSPASIKVVEARVKEFLDDPQQQRVSLFTVSNWKLGVIFAAPFCLLTILFVVSWSIWLGQTLAKPFQILRVDEPPESDEAGGEQADQ